MKTLNSYITEKLKINKDYKNPVSSNELICHILDYPLFKKNLGYHSKNTKGYGEFKPVEILTRMISYINHYPTRIDRDIRNSKIEEVQYAINILDGHSKDNLFKDAENCKEYTHLSFLEIPYGSDIPDIVSNLYDHQDMIKKYNTKITFSYKNNNSIVLKCCTNGNYVVFVLFRLTENNEEEFRAFYICTL